MSPGTGDKAKVGVMLAPQDLPVLGGGYLSGVQLVGTRETAQDETHAAKMLAELSGKQYQAMTAAPIADRNKVLCTNWW